MANLAEHWSVDWLDCGWHRCKVTEYEMFTYNSNNPGVKFKLRGLDRSGRAEASFVILENCFWKLASFARACGMSEEAAAGYNPENQNHHKKLLDRVLYVEVEPNGEYKKVDNWCKEDEPPNAPPTKIDRSTEMNNEPVPTAAEAKDGDDSSCPF
jgi:hypothetical protein